jgi:hypothetical protein
MSAHESQFFEWLPWTSGTLDEVPETKEERLTWLADWRKPRVKENVRSSIIKWYGENPGNQAKYAEAFEVCEYGRQPSDDEIKKLFPMLGK